MLVSTHVAPAASQGRTSAPGGASTTRSKGPSLPARACWTSSASSASASGPGSSIGNSPSHPTARRTGRRLGQLAATQTGMRGRCSGSGRNPPLQNRPSRSRPSSSRRPRSQAPVAQVIQGDRLPCELLHAPAGQRGDHRPEPKGVGRRGDGAERHPRVGHGAFPGRVGDPVPKEHAVPADGLRRPGKLGQEPRVRQLVERRQVQSTLHRSSPGSIPPPALYVPRRHSPSSGVVTHLRLGLEVVTAFGRSAHGTTWCARRGLIAGIVRA